MTTVDKIGIEGNSTISIYCKVVQYQPVSGANGKVAGLRVMDGTLTSQHFSQHDFEDLEHDLKSRNIKICPAGNQFVDVVVFSPPEIINTLMAGSLVCLDGVVCEEHKLMVEESHILVYDLFMDEKNAPYTIQPLPSLHPAAVEIVRQIELLDSTRKEAVLGEASCGTAKDREPRSSGNNAKRPRLSDNMESLSQTSTPVITVVEGEHPNITLQQFLRESKRKKLYLVQAVVTEVTPVFPVNCHLCRDNEKEKLLCQHSWVWGLCTKCKDVSSPLQLCENFSLLLLARFPTLPCLKCHPHKKGDAVAMDVPVTQLSVIPTVKLKLNLKDFKSKCEAKFQLTANSADKFFGVTSAFQWLAGKRSERVRALMTGLLSSCFPLSFVVRKEGKRRRNITATTLEFTAKG